MKPSYPAKSYTARKALSPLIAALLIFAGLAPAQTTVPEDRTAQLIKKVQELEADLAAIKAELQQQGASVAAPAAAAAQPNPSPDAAQAAALIADTAPADEHVLGPLEFRGYSDFTFGRPIFSALPAGGLSGSPQSFNLGDFDLFVNATLGNHLTALAELLVTSDFTNEFSAEMDRLMLTFSANKYFKISAGKYHTAIGYYSNAFYRARYFQTATGAPILFTDEDDGGIIPVHSIGLSATGELPSGPLGLHWVAEVSNGMASRNTTVEPIQNFVDENNGKAVNFALYARPESINGLDIGGSFYRDMQHPDQMGTIEQRIYSAHAAMVRPHLELIAESVLLQHELLAINHNFNTVSVYGQASYKFGKVRPYFRYEYQNIPATDPIFGAVGRMSGPSLGTRYDFSDFGAFKVQYGLLGVRSGPSTNAFQAQLAFAF